MVKIYPEMYSPKPCIIYNTSPPGYQRRDPNRRPKFSPNLLYYWVIVVFLIGSLTYIFYRKEHSTIPLLKSENFTNFVHFKGNQSFSSNPIKSIKIKLTKNTVFNSFNIKHDESNDDVIKFDYELIGSEDDFKSKVNIKQIVDELKFKVKSTKSETILNLNINLPQNFKVLDMVELKVSGRRGTPGSIQFNLNSGFNLKNLELKHIDSEIYINKFNLANCKIELDVGNIVFNRTNIENLKIRHELGIIKFNLAKLNNFQLKGKSSKVEGSLLKSKEIEVKNRKGAINLNLIDNPSKRSITLDSKYGDIQLELNKHYVGWFEVNSEKGKAEIEEKSCCLNDVHLINNSTADILGYKGSLGILDSECKIISEYGNTKLVF